MSALDIILLLCFVPFLVRGLTKGFIAQLASIVSVFVGVWLSFRFAGAVSSWLMPYLDVSEKVLHVVAFILIMVAVILVFYFLGKALHGLFKIVMLGWLDKLLGLVFAAILGTMVIGILIMIFNTVNSLFGLVGEEVLAESVLYTQLKDIAYTLFPYFKELLFKQ